VRVERIRAGALDEAGQRRGLEVESPSTSTGDLAESTRTCAATSSSSLRCIAASLVEASGRSPPNGAERVSTVALRNLFSSQKGDRANADRHFAARQARAGRARCGRGRVCSCHTRIRSNRDRPRAAPPDRRGERRPSPPPAADQIRLQRTQVESFVRSRSLRFKGGVEVESHHPDRVVGRARVCCGSARLRSGLAGAERKQEANAAGARIGDRLQQREPALRR